MEIGTVSQVQVKVTARKDSYPGPDAPTVSMSAKIKIGGTEFLANLYNLGWQYGTSTTTWTTNPATGQAWTWSNIDDLQAGIRMGISEDAETPAFVTQVWVVVSVGTTTTTYTYGREDQLLRTSPPSGSPTTYTYDLNGNLRTAATGASTTTYAYDVENRVTSVTSGGSTTSFQYSAEGKRMKRVAGGVTTFFGHDYAGLSGLDEVLEEYASDGTLATKYAHGPGVDEPLGVRESPWAYHHRDGLGSVTRITDQSGTAIGTYRYNAFGTYSDQSGVTSAYGFTSRENEGSLLFYRARYYDPATGRFTVTDPAGPAGGYNAYAYVGNNPATRTDLSGLWAVSSHLFDGESSPYAVDDIATRATPYHHQRRGWSGYSDSSGLATQRMGLCKETDWGCLWQTFVANLGTRNTGSVSQ